MLQVTQIAPFLAVSDSTILLDYFAGVHVVGVLVLQTIPYSHKKNCNSDVIYSLPLSVCRHLTEWEVLFDHSQKTALIASAASDFLCKKATLQQEKQSSRNVITHLYLEYDKVGSSRRSEWINPRVLPEHLGFSGKLRWCSFPKAQPRCYAVQKFRQIK